MTVRRIGVVGAGQVWRRLYRPASALVGELDVVAIADPADAGAFARPEDMLGAAAVDGVIVLSPPHLHSEHVSLAVARGIMVLVEKPPALSGLEMDAWAAAGGTALVRPAFSRRYWRRYRGAGRKGHRWEFELQTDPTVWGATTSEPVERDLLPHAVDLARWLSGEEIARIHVQVLTPGRMAGVFELSGGGEFRWDVAHGNSYREALLMDGGEVSDSKGIIARVRRRVTRGPTEDVAGIAEMLRDWTLAMSGAAPSRLATFEDARANVAIVEQVMIARLEQSS